MHVRDIYACNVNLVDICQIINETFPA